jgi:hypothetical protein
MNLITDPDIKAVLEFMQQKIPANKLVGVAERIPPMARLLWDVYPQQPCRPLAFDLPKPDLQNPSLQDARVSPPVHIDVGDGSVEVKDAK